MKIKTANLYNCEGFMTDIELVDKINNTFKNILNDSCPT